jgi:hypothetical protein
MIDKLRARTSAVHIYAASGLLLLLFLQAILSGSLASPTFDEFYDLARGYAYARGTDLRMQQEHPVLVDGLGGLMLLLMPELTPPEQIPGWEDAHLFHFSQALVWQLGHDVDKMVFLARFPVIGLALILGAVVYRWADDLYAGARSSRPGSPRTSAWSNAGGLLALALCVFNPNIVAHARVLSTDLGAACLATATLYLWWRWARKPSPGRVAGAASVLGLALAAKTSNTLLIPLIGVLSAIHTVRQHWRWSRAAVAWGAMVAGALFVLWALYRFEVRPAPYLAEIAPFLGDIPVPAASYWEAIAWVRHEMELGRPAFLWGQHTIWGWWYYFPLAFVLKTPLPVLILLGLAVWLHITRRINPRPPADYALWIYPPLYFGLSAFSTLNLGYRHILSTVPLMTIYAAQIVAWPGLRSSWLRRGLDILLAWLVITAVAIFPHHLAYFNELVGGPSNGYRSLVDSNLDWGQGLKHLRRYLTEQGIDDLWLGYFGTADPAYYLEASGIHYRSLFAPNSSSPAEGFTPINPAPGWYAISATVLQGPFSPEPDLFDWFRRHEPVAKVGYSIFVYRVEADPDPPTWLGVCFTPEDPGGEVTADIDSTADKIDLDDDWIVRRFGAEISRVVHFDCAQSWVYPAGDEPGWYLVPTAQVPFSELSESTVGTGPIPAFPLTDAEIIYHERGLRTSPGYTVVRISRGRGEPSGGCGQSASVLQSIEGIAPLQEAWSSPALAPTDADPVAVLSVLPGLGGQVEFLGYGLYPPETADCSNQMAQAADFCLPKDLVSQSGELVLTTAWRVSARPEQPPLSVFAHLVGPAGAASVGDGLGFSAIQWNPGDVFVQRSRLELPPGLSPGRYWLQVGMYSLATDERLPVLQDGQPVSDRILLAPVEWRGEP